MLNKKRLKNLSLIKQKKLLGQKKEITTLDNEFIKNKSNKEKLKDILNNTSINPTELAWNIKEKSQYKLKLIEQIYISENREKFLSIEMKRAKTNLGKLIKEKEVVDKKIKLLTQLEKNNKENKFINTMPPQKNN
tara:strand:- start:189 stop:593 length:405 start_codon:yes stop_codon:yes gene_type:complete